MLNNVAQAMVTIEDIAKLAKVELWKIPGTQHSFFGTYEESGFPTGNFCCWFKSGVHMYGYSFPEDVEIEKLKCDLVKILGTFRVIVESFPTP